MPERIILLWDEYSLDHATRHRVSAPEINAMVSGYSWIMARDTGKRPHRRRVVGWTPARRAVTVVVEWTGIPNHYRPVTSWPSTPAEIALYWERKR